MKNLHFYGNKDNVIISVFTLTLIIGITTFAFDCAIRNTGIEAIGFYILGSILSLAGLVILIQPWIHTTPKSN